MSSLNHPIIKNPSSKPILVFDKWGSRWENDGAYSIKPKNNKTLKIPIGRTNISTSDDFISSDINKFLTADSSSSNIVLNIPDSFGEVGDWIVVKKLLAANQIIITCVGSDILEGDNKVLKKERIIHLMKISSNTWHATGGVA